MREVKYLRRLSSEALILEVRRRRFRQFIGLLKRDEHSSELGLSSEMANSYGISPQLREKCSSLEVHDPQNLCSLKAAGASLIALRSIGISMSSCI